MFILIYPVKRMKLPFLKIIIATLVMHQLATGQYLLKTYGPTEGLTQKSTLSQIQDNSGEMWFGTDDGIMLYDGFRFETLGSNQGFFAKRIRTLLKDAFGSIWAFPENMKDSVYIISGSKFKRIPYPSSEQSNLLLAASFCTSGNTQTLCAITQKSILIFADNQWKSVTPLLDGQFAFMIAPIGKDFLLATNYGLYRVNAEGELSAEAPELNLPDKAVLGLGFFTPTKNSSPILYLYGLDWLGCIVDGEFRLISKEVRIPNIGTRTYSFFVSDNIGHLLFGGQAAKYSFNLKRQELTPLTKANGYHSDGANSAFVDREGTVWFTSGRGVSKIANFIFRSLTKTHGLQEDEVTSVLELGKNQFLFGHENGLTFMRYGVIQKVSFPQKVWSRVMDLHLAKNGIIYVSGASRGLGIIYPGSITPIWFSPGERTRITSTIEAPDGRIITLADNCIYEFSDFQFKKLYSDDVLHKIFRKLFVFPGDSTVYFTTSAGVFAIRGKQVIKLPYKINGVFPNAFSLYKHKPNDFIISTAKGVFQTDGTNVTLIENGTNKITERMYFITRDNDGFYYFGSDLGVVRWDLQSDYRILGIAEGLAGNETNRDGGLIDSDGRLWVGTETGVSVLDLSLLGEAPPAPELLLHSLTLFSGESFNLDKKIRLSSGENSFYFKVRGMTFRNEEFNEYEYMLEGFEKNWNRIPQRYLDNIRYYNLPSGDYILHVRVRNGNGPWSEIVSSEVISINRPLLYQPWFIIIMLAVLTAIFVPFGLYFVKRKYTKELEETLEIKTNAVNNSKKQLEYMNKDLELRVEERTKELVLINEKLQNEISEKDLARKELQQLNAQLSEINAAKDKFFSIVAHDLRSPFQGLLGFSTILLEELEGLSISELKRYIGHIHQSTRGVFNLLDNLLTWSRLQLGKLEVILSEINPNHLADEVFHSLKANAVNKEITLHNLIPEDVTILADENMLRTVIQNLVSNALKFTNSGGSITVKYTSDELHHIISVSDTGVGIDEDKLDVIFRIDQSISTRGTKGEEGTGLGLILCYEMIKAHKGALTVSSRKDEGSTFTIILPQKALH